MSFISQQFTVMEGKRPAQAPMRLKNFQPIVKNKVLPRPEQHPVKPAMKPKPIEGKLVKAVNKTPAVNTDVSGKVQKPEPKKQEAVNKADKCVRTPDKACGGHYELNALMTRMVDAELQDIMTKIWQVLPDAPSTETECVVVDTLRNKAGDDLRNVLGLNITSRLLNVYNPLLMKVKFNGKPRKEELREFLRKYHFTVFARKAVNIFAAKVRSIDDYDRICGDSDVRCGSVKVTVSPVYNFTSRPFNLKTSYKDMSIEDKPTASKDARIKLTGNKVDHNNKDKNESLKNVSQNVPSKVNEETNKAGNVAKLNNPKVQSTVDSKSLEKNQEAKKPTESPNKPVQNTRKTEITKKPEPPKIIKTDTKVINQSKSETKVTAQKVSAKVASTDAAATKGTEAAPTKAAPTETTSTQVVSPTKVTPTTMPGATSTKVVTPTKNTPTKLVSPNKMAPTKAVSPTKVALQKAIPRTATKVENDFDELDDHDILALMSEGIILDECSGSDHE